MTLDGRELVLGSYCATGLNVLDPMLWAADASAGLIGAFYAEQGRGSHHWFQQFRPFELHQHHVVVA
jgi:hypothetical protein